MKKKITPILYIPGRRVCLIGVCTVMASAMMSSCGHSSGSRQATDSLTVSEDTVSALPAQIVQLVNSVKNRDIPEVASKINYPLARPYPIKDVVDSAAMVSYYDNIVDDSLISVMTNARRPDWHDEGWRGWTLHNGQYIWIDEGVYEIPYISKKERKILKELSEKDLGSLPVKYTHGYRPVACLRGNRSKRIFRVDVNDSTEKYRLMVFSPEIHKGDEPKEVFHGELSEEGTEGNRIYSFSGNGKVVEYQRDVSSIDEPPVVVTTSNGKTESEEVESVYWLDLIETVSNVGNGE